MKVDNNFLPKLTQNISVSASPLKCLQPRKKAGDISTSEYMMINQNSVGKEKDSLNMTRQSFQATQPYPSSGRQRGGKSVDMPKSTRAGVQFKDDDISSAQYQ